MWDLPPQDEPKWRRRFAALANNRAWTLAEMPSRSAQEDDEMLDAAHAAAHLWRGIGNERNAALAHLLLAQVHALAGNAVLADRSMKTAAAFFAAQKSDPPQLAMLHAIAANVAHSRGDAAAHRREYEAAQNALDAIDNAQEKQIAFATLRVVPKPAP